MVCNATYAAQPDDFLRGEVFVNVTASAAVAGGRVYAQRYVWVMVQSRPQLVVEVDTLNCTLPAQAGALSAWLCGSTHGCHQKLLSQSSGCDCLVVYSSVDYSQVGSPQTHIDAPACSLTGLAGPIAAHCPLSAVRNSSTSFICLLARHRCLTT